MSEYSPIAWQQDALDALVDGKNVLVHGGFGHGKSTFLTQALNQAMQLRHNEPPQLIAMFASTAGRVNVVKRIMQRQGLNIKDIVWTCHVESLQGMCGPLFLAIDNADDLPEEFWMVLEGVCTGQGVQIAMVGVPLESATQWVQLLKTPPPNTEVIHATSNMVCDMFVDNRKQEWGVGSSNFRAYVEGELPA